MKRNQSFLLSSILFLIAISASAQITITQLPSGGNKKAWVGERVGITDITINYDRPGVKGREGKIWGELVPAGYVNLGFGSAKESPWRAGANENTTIEFSNDVKIEDQLLKAGKYGFFIAYDAAEPTIIFSKNSTSWGSYYYEPKEDVLRVKVKIKPLTNSVERLKYEFLDQTENSATIALEWEKQMISFKVETDYVADQIASFRRELRSQRGFFWLAWDQAAQWALQHNTNLDEALLWSDSATGRNFGGSNIFQPWTTKADILYKLGRTAESDAAMKQALAFASVQDMHQYGRRLVQQKRTKEAMDVFKMNYQKNPGQFTTLVGMARGYSAMGDYKNALKFAKQSLSLAPDALNKTSMEGAIKKLEAEQDIN
jgi:tetratricopeptide (TPR) repeat protein